MPRGAQEPPVPSSKRRSRSDSAPCRVSIGEELGDDILCGFPGRGANLLDRQASRPMEYTTRNTLVGASSWAAKMTRSQARGCDCPDVGAVGGHVLRIAAQERFDETLMRRRGNERSWRPGRRTGRATATTAARLCPRHFDGSPAGDPGRADGSSSVLTRRGASKTDGGGVAVTFTRTGRPCRSQRTVSHLHVDTEIVAPA
jgi:hypothetical protein